MLTAQSKTNSGAPHVADATAHVRLRQTVLFDLQRRAREPQYRAGRTLPPRLNPEDQQLRDLARLAAARASNHHPHFRRRLGRAYRLEGGGEIERQASCRRDKVRERRSGSTHARSCSGGRAAGATTPDERPAHRHIRGRVFYSGGRVVSFERLFRLNYLHQTPAESLHLLAPGSRFETLRAAFAASDSAKSILEERGKETQLETCSRATVWCHPANDDSMGRFNARIAG